MTTGIQVGRPVAQPDELRSLFLGNPLIQYLVDNVQSFCLSPAHGDHVHFRHSTLPLRQGIVT